MPRKQTIEERVREALSHLPDVQEKRMFGSLGFIVNGKLCVSARTERIMCRIKMDSHDAALMRKGVRTVVMKGKGRRGYVYVDADSVTTKRALKYWIDLTLKCNAALTEKLSNPSTFKQN